MSRHKLKNEDKVREKLMEVWAKSLGNTENGVMNDAVDWDEEGIREQLFDI